MYSFHPLHLSSFLFRLSQQTSKHINKEVLYKLTMKNKEVRGLLKITEEKESELCELRKQLKENAGKYLSTLFFLCLLFLAGL